MFKQGALFGVSSYFLIDLFTVILLKITLPYMKKSWMLMTLLIAFSMVFGQPGNKPSLTILFIPLDDRPPCLQFTLRMALIGDAEIITPPKEILGRFTKAGQSDEIIKWMKKQDLKSFDAAIISVDMLVYGGLVASRAHDVENAAALARIHVLRDIHKKAPELPLYVQNVIMRLAPTADGKNESYRTDLAKWAEISVIADKKSREETRKLESKIPAEALAGYKKARQRNLLINLKSIEFVRSGIIRYLILSQDDAKPVGIHVADRQRLNKEILHKRLTNKIAVQPGADEVSMLLLARALNEDYKYAPGIKPIFSSGRAASTVMPFEDKPLDETVRFHIRATGSRELVDEKQADLLFYVFASRHEPGRAVSFAAEIEEKVRQGRSVIVADIDPIGNVQGGDSAFTIELGNRGLFSEINGYASWNTAANTIGTALPQGVIFSLAKARLFKNNSMIDRIWAAQNWFTFHRVLDDYYFHGLERLNVNKHFGQSGLSSTILDETTKKQFENYAMVRLSKSFHDLSRMYFGKTTNGRQNTVKCQQPADMSFRLPWNRTFEAEIDFKLDCKVAR